MGVKRPANFIIKLFVIGFAMSCKIAAHLSHKSSVFLEILSKTSKV